MTSSKNQIAEIATSTLFNLVDLKKNKNSKVVVTKDGRFLTPEDAKEAKIKIRPIPVYEALIKFMLPTKSHVAKYFRPIFSVINNWRLVKSADRPVLKITKGLSTSASLELGKFNSVFALLDARTGTKDDLSILKCFFQTQENLEKYAVKILWIFDQFKREHGIIHSPIIGKKKVGTKFQTTPEHKELVTKFNLFWNSKKTKKSEEESTPKNSGKSAPKTTPKNSGKSAPKTTQKSSPKSESEKLDLFLVNEKALKEAKK